MSATEAVQRQWVDVRYMAVAHKNLVGSGSRRMWLDEIPAWLTDRNRQDETVMIVSITPA